MCKGLVPGRNRSTEKKEYIKLGPISIDATDWRRNTTVLTGCHTATKWQRNLAGGKPKAPPPVRRSRDVPHPAGVRI